MSLFNGLRCAFKSSYHISLINAQYFKFSSLNEILKQKINSMIKSDKVVIFIKGMPASPKCGFSNAVVQILRMHNVDYKSYNVLTDDELRKGIKEFSNWPTIPQIYIDGQFVGGCDILLQMHRSGELIDVLKKVGIQSSLENEKEKEKEKES